MNLSIQDVENRIKQLEETIAQSLAQHHSLVGMLQEAKFFLSSMTKVADIIAPASPVTEIMNEANNLIESIAE